jgi:hypothetical protein
MSRDYAAVERELLDELEQRTGRDLPSWMAAIDDLGPIDRNARIDHLRSAGLSFAHASWLERIHHNGGKPIYVGRPAPRGPTSVARPVAAPRPPVVTAVTPDAPVPVPSAPEPIILISPPPPPAVAEVPAPLVPVAPSPRPSAVAAPSPDMAAVAVSDVATDGELAALLAGAKAYRPLAEMLMGEIRRVLPDLRVGIVDGLVALSAGRTFALLQPTARELRLALTLGARPMTPPLVKARMVGAPTGFAHMVVLTDARQIDAGLLDMVKAARALASEGD